MTRPLSKPAPDAATIAEAVGAACQVRRLDPGLAYGSTGAGRAVRILAGAALKARFGTPATTLAPLLRLAGPELSPSMLVKNKVTTDDPLAVAEMLGGEVAGVSPPADPVLHPAAPPTFQPRERKQVKASAPKAVGRPAMAPVRRPQQVMRLKAVTPDIARWGRMFLASPIWSADEVADLFGVHPDALVDAIEPATAA